MESVGGGASGRMGAASAEDAAHMVRHALYKKWGVTFARARARCLLSGLEYVGSSFPLSLSLSLQREAAARRLVNEIASFARSPSLSSPRDSLFGRC